MLLVAFASNEGHTHKISERIATLARERGIETRLYDSESLEPVPNVAEAEAVVVAASVHEDRHQESITNFVIAHREQMQGKPSAFISVSLSAATNDGRLEAKEYVDHFLAETGWTPTATLLLGGALQWDDCDYFQRQVLLHILTAHGLEAEQKGRHEFTDWTELTRFVRDFLPSH